MFLLAKAALLAAAITTMGFFFMDPPGSKSLYARPSTIYPTSSFRNGFTGYPNPSSSSSCNCTLIMHCLSSLQGNQSPRFCGFEGIQRKICCDNDNNHNGEESVGNSFLNTAQQQSQAAKFYRNQFLYRDEKIGVNNDGNEKESKTMMTTTNTRATSTTTPKTETERPKEDRKLTPPEEELRQLQKEAGAFLEQYFPDYFTEIVKNLTQDGNVTFQDGVPVPKTENENADTMHGLFHVNDENGTFFDEDGSENNDVYFYDVKEIDEFLGGQKTTSTEKIKTSYEEDAGQPTTVPTKVDKTSSVSSSKTEDDDEERTTLQTPEQDVTAQDTKSNMTSTASSPLSLEEKEFTTIRPTEESLSESLNWVPFNKGRDYDTDLDEETTTTGSLRTLKDYETITSASINIKSDPASVSVVIPILQSTEQLSPTTERIVTPKNSPDVQESGVVSTTEAFGTTSFPKDDIDTFGTEAPHDQGDSVNLVLEKQKENEVKQPLDIIGSKALKPPTFATTENYNDTIVNSTASLSESEQIATSGTSKGQGSTSTSTLPTKASDDDSRESTTTEPKNDFTTPVSDNTANKNTSEVSKSNNMEVDILNGEIVEMLNRPEVTESLISETTEFSINESALSVEADVTESPTTMEPTQIELLDNAQSQVPSVPLSLQNMLNITEIVPDNESTTHHAPNNTEWTTATSTDVEGVATPNEIRDLEFVSDYPDQFDATEENNLRDEQESKIVTERADAEPHGAITQDTTEPIPETMKMKKSGRKLDAFKSEGNCSKSTDADTTLKLAETPTTLPSPEDTTSSSHIVTSTDNSISIISFFISLSAKRIKSSQPHTQTVHENHNITYEVILRNGTHNDVEFTIPSLDTMAKKLKDGTGHAIETTTSSSFKTDRNDSTTPVPDGIQANSSNVDTSGSMDSDQSVSLSISTGRGNRSLTTGEAIVLARQLGSQVSNVVNQLLLTSHKNFHLLPVFTECASAKKGRKKSRLLNLEYEHLPHLVQLGYKENGGLVYPCSGTLISKRYVLTSASCMNNRNPITMVLLEDELNNNHYMEVERIILHQEYVNLTHNNDIALIRLTEPQGKIKPICLPFEDAYGIWESIRQNPGDQVFLAGWVKQNGSEDRIRVNETTVDIVPDKHCKGLVVSSRTFQNQLCTTSPFSSPNYLNNGSPLSTTMTRHKLYIQIGLLSKYSHLAQLHTKVSSYLEWILNQLED